MERNRPRHDDAASPVVATIVLVAIAIVIAAVLSVSVSQFRGDGPPPKMLNVQQSAATNLGSYNGSLTLTLVSAPTRSDCTGLEVVGEGGQRWRAGDPPTSEGYSLTFGGASCERGRTLVAGDAITLRWWTLQNPNQNPGPAPGEKLTFLDAASNTVIWSTTVQAAGGSGSGSGGGGTLVVQQNSASNLGGYNGSVTFKINIVSAGFDCADLTVTGRDGMTWFTSTPITTGDGYYIKVNGAQCAPGTALAADDAVSLHWVTDNNPADNPGPNVGSTAEFKDGGGTATTVTFK